jgi:hypothetical protein
MFLTKDINNEYIDLAVRVAWHVWQSTNAHTGYETSLNDGWYISRVIDGQISNIQIRPPETREIAGIDIMDAAKIPGLRRKFFKALVEEKRGHYEKYKVEETLKND